MRSHGTLPIPEVESWAYGPHPRNMLRLWKARAQAQTPLVLWIHGGGWIDWANPHHGGPLSETLLTAGVSMVEIDYRYLQDAEQEGIFPPVEAPMRDAARALQFIRHKAPEWNVDGDQIFCAGESAGAATALWLAFHPDLADGNSSDPVARQSTRLRGVFGLNAQTSLDPEQLKLWIPNIQYGGHAFGITGGRHGQTAFERFLSERDRLLPWIREYSPISLAGGNAPPTALIYNKEPPALGQPQKDPTHSSHFGLKLKEHLDALGVPCRLVYPEEGAPPPVHLGKAVMELIRACASLPPDDSRSPCPR